MRILFVSLGLLGHDGRQGELLASLKRIASVYVVAPSLNVEYGQDVSTLMVRSRGERATLSFYLKFIMRAVRVSYKEKYDAIFIDDYQVSLAGLMLMFLHRNCPVVVDCREFYYGRRMPGLGRWLVKAERILIKRAEIVVAANDFRAHLMRILYDIKMPLVFENVRRLDAGNGKRERESRELCHLVSTGGCSLERGTLELVKAVGAEAGIVLTIIGKGKDRDYNIIANEILNRQIENVKILDRVPFAELGNILAGCDGGVVEYHTKDLNNYFCASGKVYEYISLGIPVITTPNPPLASVVEKFGCGVVARNWSDGVNEFVRNYKRYKEAALSMSQKVDVESNREVFSIDLKCRLDKVMNEKGL